MTELTASAHPGTRGDQGDDLLNELFHLAAVWNLTPTERVAVEKAIPGCVPGDILAGNVRIQVVRRRLDHKTEEPAWPANEIEIGFAHPDTGKWTYIRVELLGRAEISQLAKAFLWLLEHDDQKGPGHAA